MISVLMGIHAHNNPPISDDKSLNIMINLNPPQIQIDSLLLYEVFLKNTKSLMENILCTKIKK